MNGVRFAYHNDASTSGDDDFQVYLEYDYDTTRQVRNIYQIVKHAPQTDHHHRWYRADKTCDTNWTCPSMAFGYVGKKNPEKGYRQDNGTGTHEPMYVIDDGYNIKNKL